MRRILLLMFSILMLCAMLCGCGEKSVPEMASEVVSDVEEGMNGVVSDMDGIIEDESDNTDESGSAFDNETMNNTDGTSSQTEAQSETPSESFM